MLLFEDNMMIYVGIWTDKWLELLKGLLDKCKINLQKSIALSLDHNNHLDYMTENRIPFIIVTKATKYLKIKQEIHHPQWEKNLPSIKWDKRRSK